MKYNTGLNDLDLVLNSTGLDPQPMKIDKEMFDAIILPLLTDFNLPLTEKERFDHLCNIWVNYYIDISKRVKPTVNFSRENKDLVVPMNGLYMPMAIISLDGTVNAITPSLLNATILPGMTEVFANYQMEHKTNPMGANVRLIETFKSISIGRDAEWVKFLEEYGRVETIKEVSAEEQGLFEG